VTVAAGIVLTVFGALGAWFITRNFPHARFLRASYALMAFGGMLFIAWSLSKILALGAAAAIVVAAGALAGIAGALRKELRVLS
jgi:hypothetical protein